MSEYLKSMVIREGNRRLWDVNEPDSLPQPNIPDLFNMWPDGAGHLVYSSEYQEAQRHCSGWAMRNTNNHNIAILKKSCLGVLVCNKQCLKMNGDIVCIRPAICDKARKKQMGKRCPNPNCSGVLILQACRGHGGYPVTHFWRHANSKIYFMAKGKHDHSKPELKISGYKTRVYTKTDSGPRKRRQTASYSGGVTEPKSKRNTAGAASSNLSSCTCGLYNCICVDKPRMARAGPTSVNPFYGGANPPSYLTHKPPGSLLGLSHTIPPVPNSMTDPFQFSVGVAGSSTGLGKLHPPSARHIVNNPSGYHFPAPPLANSTSYLPSAPAPASNFLQYFNTTRDIYQPTASRQAEGTTVNNMNQPSSVRHAKSNSNWHTGTGGAGDYVAYMTPPSSSALVRAAPSSDSHLFTNPFKAAQETLYNLTGTGPYDFGFVSPTAGTAGVPSNDHFGFLSSYYQPTQSMAHSFIDYSSTPTVSAVATPLSVASNLYPCLADATSSATHTSNQSSASSKPKASSSTLPFLPTPSSSSLSHTGLNLVATVAPNQTKLPPTAWNHTPPSIVSAASMPSNTSAEDMPASFPVVSPPLPLAGSTVAVTAPDFAQTIEMEAAAAGAPLGDMSSITDILDLDNYQHYQQSIMRKPLSEPVNSPSVNGQCITGFSSLEGEANSMNTNYSHVTDGLPNLSVFLPKMVSVDGISPDKEGAKKSDLTAKAFVNCWTKRSKY